MIKQGDTVWYDHAEARRERKVRPALVLRVIAETALLVVGQTRRPRGAQVFVRGRSHPPARRANLPSDTHFDCERVIATPLGGIGARLGRMPPKRFFEIERACTDSLAAQVLRVEEAATVQRAALAERVRRHAESVGCEVEEIADRARMARARLRAILAGEQWWTNDELNRLAAVLEIDAAQLLEPLTPTSRG
jgi:hypothetical protein